MVFRPSFLVVSGVLMSAAQAQDAISFRDEIRPLFNKHCTACHGGVKKAGGLSFISQGEALAQTDSGLHAIVPGKPEASEMLKRMALPKTDDDHMPPAEHGDPLPASDQAKLAAWIAQGAKWEEHWAYERPRAAAPPSVKNAAWPKSGLDTFVLAKLEAAGLTPEPEQEKSRLLRRVSLDLTGLPPSKFAVEAFLADTSPEAFARQVDALLASPAFGERWAAPWLDLVRYADSKGLGLDRDRIMWQYRDWVIQALNVDMPYDEFTRKQLAGDLLENPSIADLVATACHRLTATNDEGGTDDEEFRIEAVHDRVATTWNAWQGITFACAQCHAHPYDPFSHEDYYQFFAIFNQGRDSDTTDDHPVLRVPNERKDDALAARLDSEIAALQARIHSKVQNVTNKPAEAWNFLGGMNPKFDKCGATVEKTASREEWRATGTIPVGVRLTVEAAFPSNFKQITALRLHALPGDTKDGYKLSEWGFVLKEFRAEILSGEKMDQKQEIKFVAAFTDEADPYFDPMNSLAGPVGSTPKKAEKGKKLPQGPPGGWAAFTRIHREHTAIYVPEKPLTVPLGAKLRVHMAFPNSGEGAHPMLIKRGALAVSSNPAWQSFITDNTYLADKKLLDQKLAERRKIPSVPLPIMRDLPKPGQRSTQVFVRGNWMTRGEEMEPGVPKFMPQPKEAVDRLVMANWLVSPENPLTARVLVNRLWEQLFGIGIVETVEDFGSSGEKPSHAELLDHLALRVQNDHAWSTKKILRELVLSATYRQHNGISAEKLAKDPQNRLLSRGPRLRLTAEMIRDQALLVSGLLTEKLGGPPVYPPLPPGVWNPFQENEKWPTAEVGDPNRYRRSIYTHTKRSIPNPMAANFDAPSREVCSQRRVTSNTPVQALTLLNDEVFQEAITKLATDLAARQQADLSTSLGAAYHQLFHRPISPHTLATLAELWKQAPQPLEGWKNVVLVLMNSDEFLTR